MDKRMTLNTSEITFILKRKSMANQQNLSLIQELMIYLDSAFVADNGLFLKFHLVFLSACKRERGGRNRQT